MFQQRHYEVIAEVIKDVRDDIGAEQLAPSYVLDCLANCLAAVFSADNINFNHEKWDRACDVGRRFSGAALASGHEFEWPLTNLNASRGREPYEPGR